MRWCDHLICLVGSNPLPNYLAVLQAEPQHVTLFYSLADRGSDNSSEEVAERLKSVIEGRTSSSCELRAVHATDPGDVRMKLASADLKRAWLNYTGGTKVMAVQAYAAWSKLNSDQQARAFYLDDSGDGCFRFDGPGGDRELNGIVSFEELYSLHGLTISGGAGRGDGDPTPSDAASLADHVLEQGDPTECAKRIYDRYHKPPEPVTLDLNAVGLGSRRVEPGSKIYKHWAAFLCGGWLEVWCQSLIQQADGGAGNTRQGDHLFRNRQEFEVDVLRLRGHRLYLLSCTTDGKKGRVKGKAFEAQVRARQFGDHTRAAVASLAPNSACDSIRNSLSAVLRSAESPAIFGMDDLREWRGGRLDSLKRWLEVQEN